MDFLYSKNLFFVSTTLRFNVLSYKFNKVCILALIVTLKMFCCFHPVLNLMKILVDSMFM